MAVWECGLCEIERSERRKGYRVVVARHLIRELAERHLDRDHPEWRAGNPEQQALVLEGTQ